MMYSSAGDGEESNSIELVTRVCYDQDEYDFDSPKQSASRSLLGRTVSQTTLVDGRSDVDRLEQHPPSLGCRRTPIPKRQLFTLCAVRIVDPIGFTQIFPYVNEMMRDLHVTSHESRIGFYSGFVDSLFAISQLVSIYHWGKLSDRIGRRPVIFTSTLGIAFCTIWFGLSTTLYSVLAARCISGLLAGNIAVIHSTLGELTDESNQAIIFPIYGVVWPLGAIIGPLIGGTFSHPDIHWPHYFNTDWFKRHPYFLPCIICSTLSFIAAMFGFNFLEETHPRKRRDTKSRQGVLDKSKEYVSDNLSRNAAPSSASIRKLMANPLIRSLCLSGAGLAFLASAFDVVFVLFCFSPVKSGGLSRPADEIGYALAVSGLTSALLQLFIMPWLLRTFDLDKMYILCMGLYPLTFASLPVLNWIARYGMDAQGEVTVGWVKIAVWAGVVLILTTSRISALAFSLALVLIKNASPSPDALGATNGLSQWFQCMTRSFSPAFVSSLFALSIDKHLLGGHLWVAIMCFLSFLALYITTNIPKARANIHRMSCRNSDV